MHIAEHERDEAQGFSVFTPDGEGFLASLCVNEVAPLIDQSYCGVQARMEYGIPAHLKRAFLHVARRWVTGSWWSERAVPGSHCDAAPCPRR